MKRFLSMLVMVLLIFNAFSMIASAEEEKSTLSVEGNYTIINEVDEAYITVGIKTQNMDFKAMQEENRKKMNAVVEGIKNLGVDEKYIKTTTYDTREVFEYVKRDYYTGIYYNGTYDWERVFKGYEMIHYIQIKLTDVSMAGKVVDLTVEMGVNDLNNVRFGLSEEKRNKLYIEALEKAAENAQDKAEIIKNSFGLKELKVKTISVSKNSVTVYETGAYNESAYVAKESETSTITGGEIKITATVNVVYTY